MTWQPIDTAPKNGTNVLLLRDGIADLGLWSEDRNHYQPRPFWRYRRSVSATSDRAHQPTHWCPLPEPPEVP